MEQRCGNCKHWRPPPPGVPFEDARRRLGYCEGIPYEGDLKPDEVPLACTHDQEGYSAGISTAADFGCVLWEGK